MLLFFLLVRFLFLTDFLRLSVALRLLVVLRFFLVGNGLDMCVIPAGSNRSSLGTSTNCGAWSSSSISSIGYGVGFRRLIIGNPLGSGCFKTLAKSDQSNCVCKCIGFDPVFSISTDRSILRPSETAVQSILDTRGGWPFTDEYVRVVPSF